MRTMALWPLCCAVLLTGCADRTALRSESLYMAAPWPSAEHIRTQKDVAKYIVRARSAYDSCTVNLDALKSMDLKN